MLGRKIELGIAVGRSSMEALESETSTVRRCKDGERSKIEPSNLSERRGKGMKERQTQNCARENRENGRRDEEKREKKKRRKDDRKSRSYEDTADI